MAEPRITTGEMPPRSTEVDFKNPYTHYAPPTFDKPEYLYEVCWHEKFFPGTRLVISRFYFDSLQKAQAAFESHKKRWYGPLKNPIDKQLEKECQHIRQLARQARENHIRAEKNMEEYYPVRLREYMQYLRRAKWVKDKRRREKVKILQMGAVDATEYIDQQIEKLQLEDNYE